MTRKEKVDLFEKVYGLRTDNGEIEDLFADGSVCSQLFEQAFKAELRILAQLGVQESRDINEIYCCMNEICEHVSIRMFEYGQEMADR